jgi:hypothetical protein
VPGADAHPLDDPRVVRLQTDVLEERVGEEVLRVEVSEGVEEHA